MLYNRCNDSKICLLFNNHLYEEAISRMDIRYSCNQRDFKRYTTEETRNEMLITGLYKADEMVAVYSLSLIHISVVNQQADDPPGVVVLFHACHLIP